MNLNVDLNYKSEEMIQEVYDRYDEEKEIPNELEGRTIIHLYPKEDTVDENGEASGFIDSLFFNFNIFNIFTGKVYKRYGHYDELVLDVPCRIRAFKDLSTMVIIDSPIKISDTQSVTIYKA